MGCVNRDEIMDAVDVITAEIDKRESVMTYFGPADPKDGYRLYELRIPEQGAVFAKASFLSRAKRENDLDKKGYFECRGGDEVFFVYDRRKGIVMTDDERDEMARREEYLYEVADKVVDSVGERFQNAEPGVISVALALTVHMTADSRGLTREEQEEVYRIAADTWNEEENKGEDEEE